jgi:hypothetical protein
MILVTDKFPEIGEWAHQERSLIMTSILRWRMRGAECGTEEVSGSSREWRAREGWISGMEEKKI